MTNGSPCGKRRPIRRISPYRRRIVREQGKSSYPLGNDLLIPVLKAKLNELAPRRETLHNYMICHRSQRKIGFPILAQEVVRIDQEDVRVRSERRPTYLEIFSQWPQKARLTISTSLCVMLSSRKNASRFLTGVGDRWDRQSRRNTPLLLNAFEAKKLARDRQLPNHLSDFHREILELKLSGGLYGVAVALEKQRSCAS